MIKVCERCGKPYKAFPYNVNIRRFCSTKCANKTNSVQQIKTKQANSASKHGKKNWRYTFAYNKWRGECIKRDGYICQNCNGPVTDKTIAVHHIKSYADYPELRYKVSNGVVLCRPCHNSVDILPSRKLKSGF